MISLKSSLQKAVRRGDARRAMRIAGVMWDMNEKERIELLRRLPIVVVEDSLVVPAVQNFVCLMLKKEGYTEQDRREVVLAAGIFALLPKDFDFFSHMMEIWTGRREVSEIPELRDGKEWLWSLKTRANYGGMKSDIQMLREAVVFQNFANRDMDVIAEFVDVYRRKCERIYEEIENEGENGKIVIEPQDIDMHNVGKKLIYALQKCPVDGVPSENVESLWWWFRSARIYKKWWTDSSGVIDLDWETVLKESGILENEKFGGFENARRQWLLLRPVVEEFCQREMKMINSEGLVVREVVGGFEVQSRTDPQVFWRVVQNNGKWVCDCPKFRFRKDCHHIAEVKRRIK